MDESFDAATQVRAKNVRIAGLTFEESGTSPAVDEGVPSLF